MSLLGGLPEISGEQIRGFPQLASSSSSSPWLSTLTYHRGSEMSYIIDMINQSKGDKTYIFINRKTFKKYQFDGSPRY
jgi:hypothetical protein